ncbi:FlgO family outer membrane protein [Devosia sp. CAU 1758]
MTLLERLKLQSTIRAWGRMLIRRMLPIFAAVTVSIGASGMANAQQVAGTVEDGLVQLAYDIAERSKAAERTTIAVLPFLHADGTCSVLSTYVVDELILSLFSLADTEIDIVERSQLEAIIAELSIGEGGLLNPATTVRLGNLSGVSALTIGTITVIGNRVRLNARLVATDTGRIFSAAAVTVPNTSDLSTLMGQSAACTTTVGQRSKKSSDGGTQQGPSQQANGNSALEQIRDGIRVELRSINLNPTHTSRINAVLRLENLGDAEKMISMSHFTFTDNTGNLCSNPGNWYTKVAGIPYDSNGIALKDYSSIQPNEVIQFSITELGCESRNFSPSGSIDVGISYAVEGSSVVNMARYSMLDVPFGDE